MAPEGYYNFIDMQIYHKICVKLLSGEPILDFIVSTRIACVSNKDFKWFVLSGSRQNFIETLIELNEAESCFLRARCQCSTTSACSYFLQSSESLHPIFFYYQSVAFMICSRKSLSINLTAQDALLDRTNREVVSGIFSEKAGTFKTIQAR